MSMEQMIQEKAGKATRVTPADIEAEIQHVTYFTAAQGHMGAVHAGVEDIFNPIPESLGLLTFCVLVLRNGFTVTGESACASPENFNAEIGRKIARENAVNKVWPLLGYQLKQQIWDASESAAAQQVYAFVHNHDR